MNKWKIWFQLLDDTGAVIGNGVLCKTYKTKGNAVKYMNKIFSGRDDINAFVDCNNPFNDTPIG